MTSLSQIVCLGLSHHTAPVALREPLSCALTTASLPTSAPLDAIEELVVVSTCNRIELYASVSAPAAHAKELLLEYVAEQHGRALETFRDHCYFVKGQSVAKHLARVTAGLDSQVLGEPQILGQVTDAYMQAVATGAAGARLGLVFQCAIRAGKRARAETAIGSNPATIGSVAIALAEQIVGSLAERNVLIIGLGEMGQVTLNALRKRGLSRIALANRTRERAETLAKAWQGAVYALEELPRALVDADVVIAATAAPHPIIDRKLLAPVIAERGERDLVVIDIAVPRDVAEDVSGQDTVHLYNVDDLRGNLDAALAARQAEIPAVQAIIDQEVELLAHKLREQRVVPVISDLRQRAERIRQQELERTMRFLGEDLDPEVRKHVHHLSRSLVNKLLHEPTACLRRHAGDGRVTDEYAATIRDLFDLNEATGS